jgi:hypothetical protein
MDDPAPYEIRVAEQLDEHWARWFDGLEILHSVESSETILRGEMRDQPALFGVLGKIRDLGLTLISVQRLSPLRSQPSETSQRSEYL